jgi:trigger factor
VEQPKAWARRMKITVPAARVEKQRREVTSRLAGQVRIPGFRKGKVPAQVLAKQFGASIDQQAVEKVIGDAYKEALERERFEPITQASVSNLDYQPGADVTFEVEFEVRPQIELERLGGFEVKRTHTEVGEADVIKVLDRLREERATWTPVEAASPVFGDMASVEITPLDEEGAPRAGGMRPYQIILGKEEARPEVEEAIRSLKPGEETEFTIAHEGEEGHEGHSHRARVQLNEVKHPRLPELDDEFAQLVGEFPTLGELRARIQSDLEREAGQESESEVRRRLVEQIVEANPFEVPDAMVDQYLERLMPTREGSNPERIAEARQAMRPAAEQAIKRMLVIERVAELESLQATPSEMDARLDEVAARYGQPVGEVRKQMQKAGQLHALEDEITEEKVFAYLKSLSTVN